MFESIVDRMMGWVGVLLTYSLKFTGKVCGYMEDKSNISKVNGLWKVDIYNGVSHDSIYLPIKVNEGVREVILVKDGKEMDVTHTSDIPYLATAEELGGQHYIVRDVLEDMEVIMEGRPL